MILVTVLSLQSPPTTIPEAPGTGLGLQPGPPPAVSVQPGGLVPGGSLPDPRKPSVPAAVGSMVAGMALLAARFRRIGEAEVAIRDSLQDNLLSDVGHEDLMTIESRIAHLPVHEATAVVARLTDRELGVWMREMDGWRGGLSSAERAELLSLLVQRVRPAQLTRLTVAGRLPELVAAAVVGSPERWRPELAIDLWKHHTPDDEGWHAIAGLVGSVAPGILRDSLQQTDPSDLSAVLFEPFQRHVEGTPVLDLSAPTALLQAAAGSGDPGWKAALFHTFNRRMFETMSRKVSGPTKRPELLGALAGLLRSDPAGVVSELNHRVDPHANVTAAWVAEMIRHDRLDELDVVLTELSGAPDRLAHFTEPGTSPAAPYPNAANLGYYVGAYSRAIELISDRAGEQADLVARLFTLFTGVVILPGGGRIGLPLGPLVDSHAAEVTSRLRGGETGLKQTLWGLAKPRMPDGRLWNGVGISQFQDAWQEVVSVR